MKRVDAVTARAMMHDGLPIASLDVREAGQFGEGHALFAMPLPYSQLEQRVADLVPRPSERILLIDQGDDVAERAARRLATAGYNDLHLLVGGMPAWKAAGYRVYKGVNVPSKLLGELAEQIWHPRHITPHELTEWQSSGQSHALFDARPAPEHAAMRVPGSTCLPNGELPHRIAALGLSPGTPVVITCAGRTRGIVGTISLQLAGYDGPVCALENGTQGWTLAGHALQRNNPAATLPPLDARTETASRAAADRLAVRFDLPRIDAISAEEMIRDIGRTTYLVDVRSKDEVARDPLPGAMHAPTVQLVQATDQWLAVRRAQVILCCDTGMRSGLAAFWLKQLGYDIRLLSLAEARRLPTLPRRPAIAAPVLGALSAGAAMAALSAGARLIDLRDSAAYRAGHVAGSSWSIRPRLSRLVAANTARPVLLISDSPQTASLAARDIIEAGVTSVRIVEGGIGALRGAGAAIQASVGHPADSECIDYLFFVHDRHEGNAEAARHYLAWETGLIGQLDALERAQFRMIDP